MQLHDIRESDDFHCLKGQQISQLGSSQCTLMSLLAFTLILMLIGSSDCPSRQVAATQHSSSSGVHLRDCACRWRFCLVETPTDQPQL